MVEKQKSYSKSKNAQKLQIFSIKIHKGAGIFKNPKSFLNKGNKVKKIFMEGLNSMNKNKNIKVGGFLLSKLESVNGH